ncbi:tetratricopeptide repeat protein [candidate division KSB1 bacterium]|nr:tetratricopeptide repeat protein [candidate division KSB1 bacterium]
MAQIELYIVIAVGVVFILGLYIVFRRKKHTAVDAKKHYIEGLNLLIEDKIPEALDAFRRTVRLDTGFIDAYIKIGDILREKDAHSAVKVHRDLLVRPELSTAEKKVILRSLTMDYIELNQWREALLVIDQILDINPKSSWARDKQLLLFEELGEWQNAYNAVKKSPEMPKSEKSTRMAAYKMEIGRKLCDEHREHDARLRFRDAIREDNHFLPAYLEYTDSYIREKRKKDALNVLTKYMKTNPQAPSLVFSRLKQVLFDLGHFGDIEGLFLDLAKENPRLAEVQLSLAKVYEKKGELLKALQACKRAMDINPDRFDTQLRMIHLYSRLDQRQKAIDMVKQLSDQILQQQHPFKCDVCQTEYDQYKYRCVNCKNWNSIIRK